MRYVNCALAVGILLSAVLVSVPTGFGVNADAPTELTLFGTRQNHPLLSGGVIHIPWPGHGTITHDGDADYALGDHLDSNRVINVTSNQSNFIEYAPYGDARSDRLPAAGAIDSHYAGHPYDARQQLYLTPSRPYDPAASRFLSVDPAGGASPYAYVGGDPINFLDPGGDIRVPFFIETNTSGTYHEASIATLFGATKGMRATRGSSFDSTTGWASGSRAGKKSREVLRVGGAGEVPRSGETFWIIGGKEHVGLPNVYDKVTANWRKVEKYSEVGKRTVFIDISNTGSGETMLEQLRRKNMEGILIKVDKYGLDRTIDLHKHGVANNFQVGDNVYDRAGFLDYVYTQMQIAWPEYERPTSVGNAIQNIRPVLPPDPSVKRAKAKAKKLALRSPFEIDPGAGPSGVTLMSSPELPSIQPIQSISQKRVPIGPEGLPVSISRTHWDAFLLNEWIRLHPE